MIGSGHGAAEWGISPSEWIDFYEHLEQVGPGHKTRIWYQPTYARCERMAGYAVDGYRGCIGRTLDRISIFPDGRAYVCSFLFDTDLHFANMVDGRVVLNKDANEFDLFTKVLRSASCGSCKVSGSCMGGCPARGTGDGFCLLRGRAGHRAGVPALESRRIHRLAGLTKQDRMPRMLGVPPDTDPAK